MDPDNAVKIDDFVAQLTKCRDGNRKFTLHLDDSSGNSFIENPHAPKEDPQMTMVYYRRNAEQNAHLGLQPASQTEEKQEEEEGQITRFSLRNISRKVTGDWYPTVRRSAQITREFRAKILCLFGMLVILY